MGTFVVGDGAAGRGPSAMPTAWPSTWPSEPPGSGELITLEPGERRAYRTRIGIVVASEADALRRAQTP